MALAPKLIETELESLHKVTRSSDRFNSARVHDREVELLRATMPTINKQQLQIASIWFNNFKVSPEAVRTLKVIELTTTSVLFIPLNLAEGEGKY